MGDIKNLTDEFKSKYERFLIGCDSVEEIDLWDRDEYGEMDVFYQNDLLSIILRLIAADGEITYDEVNCLNENFGFEYTTEELADIYEGCYDAIGVSFDEKFEDAVEMLNSVNAKLADAYRELVCLICDIIIESDNLITSEETEEAKRLKELL